jgi:hypothetical protein
MAKNSAERASTGGLATLLMIVAIVATIALLVWLSFASRPPEGPAMAMDDTTDTQLDAGPTAPRVTAAEFGGNIASYANQDVNVAGVMVSNVVNEHLVWVDVPTAQGTAPFLVRMLPGAAATPPAPQSRIDVEGRVLAKTDSVLNAWSQAGAVPGGNVRATLQTGSWFIEASAIRQGAGGSQN